MEPLRPPTKKWGRARNGWEGKQLANVRVKPPDKEREREREQWGATLVII